VTLSAKEALVNSVKGKTVVMIVASSNFRDEEFDQPSRMLQQAGAEVTVASSRKTPARGAMGKVVTPALLVKDVAMTNFDAAVFVGGPGAVEYFDDPEAQRVARETVQQNKLLAAICIAPATLANAGVLKGKKATCFSSEEETLRNGGATVVRQDVVRDGKLVTANGPRAAAEFGRMVLTVLGE
jgi:protease I